MTLQPLAGGEIEIFVESGFLIELESGDFKFEVKVEEGELLDEDVNRDIWEVS